MPRLNEATWLVADELTADWEELRERSIVVVRPDGQRLREARMISPSELEAFTLTQYGFGDVDSYYADGHGFIDELQTVALRTAIDSIDWTRVIERLETLRP
jgi:hypothetical protein